MSTLTVADRAVVRTDITYAGRPDITLVRGLIAQRPKKRKSRRRREVALSPLSGHCLYCGGSSKNRGVCHGHSDLPPLDMQFAAVLHSNGLASTSPPRNRGPVGRAQADQGATKGHPADPHLFNEEGRAQ